LRYLRRLMSMLVPWTPRQQRRDAISDARREKERSRSSAAHAATIERDIARMAEANHFAQILADQIMQHHRGGT
jgi:transcription elongation GreA/GreB family factor